ncbi:hypothetical protein [uncultured Erythrobacter sp.]|uniref:ExbD/TolR family protein n=1 Tax=uncultured Erythrobacter sp. TaxID=263913 RepID=UPI00260C5637|nr:hypothetical protein [uncultured Erythrobacter sp.]
MALLAVCLCAIGVILFKPIPHAFMVDLWDGETQHPLIVSKAQTESELAPTVNQLTFAEDDTMRWNGEPISAGQLVTLLDAVSDMDGKAVVDFEPEADASYDLSARILLILTQSGAHFRIAGMEKYCSFGNGRWSSRGANGILAMTHVIWIDPNATPVTPYPAPLGVGECEPRFLVHGAR